MECDNKPVAVLCFCLCLVWLAPAGAWQADQGDGTYRNPVLYADYPDPDIVRVGQDFYMVSSTFVSSPGLTVLHSRDLVNWRIVGHAAEVVDGGPRYDLQDGTAYEGGFWAPSLRYRNGTFYIAVQPTFADGRIYYAPDPAGPWRFHQLDRSIYDPGLFFDDDGRGVIVCGHGPQSVMFLSDDCSRIVAEYRDVIDSGGEGSHLVKRGNTYYLFNANPSVWPFELRCARATNLLGPWETGHVCLTATTGGHQGAIVDIDDQDHWFGFVHQDSGAIGRMPRIGPVYWQDGWPVFGTPSQPNVMAETYPKPILGEAIDRPATSDDFSGPSLGLQWQWNHNPDPTRWSLAERPGYLRLYASRAEEIWTARNSLTQKAQGPASHAVARLDVSGLRAGDVAGLGTLGKVTAGLAVVVDGRGQKSLTMFMHKDKVGSYVGAEGIPLEADTVSLRTDFDFHRQLGLCSVSLDGRSWTPVGGIFELMFGYGSTWQGQQVVLFCYNTGSDTGGHVDIDWFALEDGADRVSTQRGRPRLNAERTTFVADNGQLLRGPYESTEWTSAAPADRVAAIKELGFNAVHLYAESFDPDYPAPGSTAPGYAVAEVDEFVEMTADLGLYLVITIGNGAHNGDHNRAWVRDFWRFYAPRYADETHVLYEIQNEPVAWGPPYQTATTPPGALEMEIEAYREIRAHAPETPVLLFTYAVLAGSGGGQAALQDIRAFNQAVFGRPEVQWTREAVAFHGYGGHLETPAALETLLAAGVPCFMTEFGAPDWGSGEGLDVELTAELERLGISWLTFQYIPPSGVSQDVTNPAVYRDLVERGGLSWTPDFGTWPVARGPFTPDGRPWPGPAAWAADRLSGTLRLEIEHYDTGGEGVATHDTDPANQGGAYRTDEGVDVAVCSDVDGGYAVGWTADGEWLEFTVEVREGGFYDLSLRYASPNSDAAVRLWGNGRDLTGLWPLPSTGGWSLWRTARRQVFLDYGRQKLRLEIVRGGVDLNWMELEVSAAGPVADATYRLLNRRTGLAMTADLASSRVVQQPAGEAATQQWRLQHLGAGQYKVTSAHNGDSWNVWAGTGNELELVWWWGAEGRHQRYLVRPAAAGFYRIAPVALGRDLQAAALTAGSAIEQSEYRDLAAQQWAILSPGEIAFPVGLAARTEGPTDVLLTWEPVPAATAYQVKRSSQAGGPYDVVASEVTETRYRDTDLSPGDRYVYVVCAMRDRQVGLPSAEARAAELHAHWTFDEGRGNTARDVTGNGWTATLVGAQWVEGRTGRAVGLDGQSAHVRLPEAVAGDLEAMTFAAWVYLDSLWDWVRIFDFGDDTTVYQFLTPRSGGSGPLRFAITRAGAGGERRIDGHEPLPTGQWVHVAVTLGHGVGVLYVDGVEVGRNEAMSLTPADLGPTRWNYLGKSQWPDPLLDGRLDDVRLYAEVLDAAQIAGLAAGQP